MKSVISDIGILQEMIKEDAKLAVSDHQPHGRKQIDLNEPQCPKSSVTILGLPDETIIIKADAFESPSTLFNGLHDECKRSDFIIVADCGHKKIILCIEMKAGKASKNKIIKQLTGTECLVKYIQIIGQEFWNRQDFLEDYVYRFVSFSHTGINKRKTRQTHKKDQTGVHDRPNKMLKISYQRNNPPTLAGLIN